MAMKIRLARGGSKKRPHYSIVAADSRMARDGRFIEKLGTYNPLLPKDSEERVKMNMERIQYWLGEGAQPTARISRFLEAAGVAEKKERNNPHKGKPHQKAHVSICSISVLMRAVPCNRMAFVVGYYERLCLCWRHRRRLWCQR